MTTAEITEIDRTLVTIEEIRSVSPIEGADAIERVTVRGWTVVTKLGEFKVGDKCVYFEIDSALPLDDERFAFLAPRGEKTLPDGTRVHVLKTARLRGVYSQGLVLPYADFPEVEAAFTDFAGRMSGLDEEETHIADMMASAAGVERLPDIAGLLGVTKYEPPLPTNVDVVGPFPTRHGRKTLSERAQNIADRWDGLAAAGPWIATEKVDGYSLSVFWDEEGAIHVCSRNWELSAPETVHTEDVYWSAVRSAGIDGMGGPNEGIQGEIAGPGIHKNPLGLDTVKVVIFAYLIDGVPQPRDAWPVSDNPDVLYAGVYDLPFPTSAGDSIEQVNGIKSLLSPARNAEGIVWHQANGEQVDALQGRTNFKCLSNKYLLKNGG